MARAGPRAPCLLVPLPLHALAVAREPPARPERLAHVDAQAVVRRALDHVLAQRADLHHRRHAAAQQLGHREVDAGAARFLVLGLAAHRQHLEEPRVPELRVAAILDERAVERRARDVGVGRDQAGRDDAVRRVDRLVHPPVEARADVEDAVALDDDHAVPQQPVPLAVEGDDVPSPNSSPPRLSHAIISLVKDELGVRQTSCGTSYRSERRLRRRNPHFPGGRLRKGGEAPLRVTAYPRVHELVDAVDRVVLEAVGAGPAAEDPAHVLDGHDHRLAHQPLLDALEGLDALGFLQARLRLLEERVGPLVAPARRVRARDGRGDEEVQEVRGGVDHRQEARVVLPRPRGRGEGRRLEPLELQVEAHLAKLRLHRRHDALVQLGGHVEAGRQRLAVLLAHAARARRPSRLGQELPRLVEPELRHEGPHLLLRARAGDERMQEAVGHIRLPLHHELDDLLAVDGVGDRLAHPRVLEDLLLHVEADVVRGQPRDRGDLDAPALEARDVLGRHVDVEVDAARLELGRARGVLRQGAEDDPVHPGAAVLS